MSGERTVKVIALCTFHEQGIRMLEGEARLVSVSLARFLARIGNVRLVS